MPTHALLGATGATGSAILRALLLDPPIDLHLNILVRSKSKLIAAFPDLTTKPTFRITIKEGPISSVEDMKSCIRGADVIHMCIATNVPTASNRVAQDVIETIVAALRELREDVGADFAVPTVFVLRSGSLNHEFNKAVPAPVHTFLMYALYYVYHDLDLACQYLESVAEGGGNSLLYYIYVDPPSIHDCGPTLTGFKFTADVKATPPSQGISYADLGASFPEIADRRKEFRGQAVIVSATGKVEERWLPLVSNMPQGLKSRIIG
nr:hypothetical protein B0A51_13958 [Rachicladosporium sp. CCFEE 5018]